MARIRSSDEIDRAAIAEVHQHLVALGGRDHKAPRLHGLREKPAVTADNEERPPVGEAQIESAGFAVDYLEARHAETLAPITSIANGPTRLLVAARLGRTRLIDNIGV